MLKLNIQLFADGGTLVIGTDLDASPLEKKLSKLETRLENQKLDLEIKASNVDNIKQDLQDVYKEVNALIKKREELKRKEAEFKTLSEKGTEGGEGLTPAEYLKYESLAREMQDVGTQQQKITTEIDTQNRKINDLNDDLTKAEVSYKKQKDAIAENVTEAARLKNELKKSSKIDFSKIGSEAKNLGDSIKQTTKKIGKMILAIFSIRSAYLAIRSATSTLSQYDEQMGTNIEWIRYLLANSLKPIIEKIIELAYKLLVYVGYIAKAWFGVDIFANASKKAFEKVNGTIQKTNKSAKELQKTIAGFDEMNILQKDGSTAIGGGGGGISLPNLPETWAIDIPDWIKWIANNGMLVANILGAIALAIEAIKIGEFFGHIIKGTEGLTKFSGGIALIVAGLALLVGQIANVLINYDEMTEKQKVVAQDLGGLGGAFTGMGIALVAGAGAMGIAIGGVVGAIVGLIAIIGTEIYKHEEERKVIMDVTEQEKKLKDAKDKARKTYDEYIRAVDTQTEAQKNLAKIQKETGLSGEELERKVKSGDITYKQMNDTQKKVYKAYIELKNATDDVTAAEQEKKKSDAEELTQEYAKQIAADKTGESYQKLKEKVVDSWEQQKITTEQATDLIERMMANMSTESTEKFYKDLPNAIKSSLDPNNYKSSWDKFKNWFNNAFKDLKPNISINGYYQISPSNKYKNAKGAIINSDKLPKLAPGGIINQPGRGVPLGSAIGGERGAEGVLPLTDSQQMALLGEAIGKWITINANITNTMNGRVISRELQKVQNESDFAFNR